MKFGEVEYLINSDLYRYAGKCSISSFIYHYIFSPGFRYSFWMRICAYFRNQRQFGVIIFPIVRLLLRYYEYKFGISIPHHTKIGSGLYIGHFGGIFISSRVTIGNNCNLSHQVTIGVSNRGPRKGYPSIGNNVYIGPGVKIIGNIKIGNNVAVGANCVVTKDIPDNGVVVGVPGRVISWDGSEGYVNRTDYDKLLRG